MLSSLVLAAAITIPPYPGATAFCSQHVSSAPAAGKQGPSINWTAYHSADTPETVVAWYQRQFAAGLHKREGKADVWRLPADKPEAVLSVTAVADAPSPTASCKDHPPATARTVIVMSTMTRHAAAPPGQGQTKAVHRTFPLGEIRRIVLRAADAEAATVARVVGAEWIDVSGVPTGGAPGYHSPDPNWKETAAADWGLDFVAERRFGRDLVVSTKNEVRYIHHRYAFTSITLRVPAGIDVVLEKRELTGDGAPDFRQPPED